MNEEKVTRETTETWRWTDWENGYVDMTPPCEMYSLRLRHESEIREHWPEKVKARIRVEILSHRPEGEDEVRSRAFVGLWQLRWKDDERQVMRLDAPRLVWTSYCGFGCGRAMSRAEAWFEKNKPTPKLAENERLVAGKLYRFRVNGGQLEWQHFTLEACDPWVPVDSTDTKPPDVAAREWLDKQVPKPLASNQVLAEDETSPIELRWHEGSPEGRYDGENSPWFTWKLGGVWCKAADAWFRANCPADRFVMDDGRVHCFEMRDDGEAECREVCAITIDGGPSAGCKSQALLALYRFRDAERAKWVYEFAPLANHVGVRTVNGQWFGYWNTDGWESLGPATPQWVRARAEKMWRERESKWTTEWSEANTHTRILHNSIQLGHYGNRGLIRLAGPEIPPHILSEARAKFRENYQLKPNEIWKRGEVVKLTWDAKNKLVDIDPLHSWKPNCLATEWLDFEDHFLDEAERLAAYDKCRAFYYEKHPGKHLYPDGTVVEFYMDGDIGRGGVPEGATGSLDSSLKECGEPYLSAWKKLSAWTDKQLAARKPEKVVFEGKVTEACRTAGESNARVVTYEDVNITFDGPGFKAGWFGDACKSNTTVRITIEPAGES